jgi:hypothetical protein
MEDEGVLPRTAVSHNPKIHALSNWSVNVECGKINPELRWMSVVTTMYNYLGYVWFARVAFSLRMVGLLSVDLSRISEIFDLNLDQGVPRHGNVVLLRRYSATVKVVSHTRSYFLQQFSQYRENFPGVDGEALFLNTVVHALDHGMHGMINKDPLWVDETHP